MLTKRILLDYVYDLDKRVTILEKDKLNARVTKLESERRGG